MDAESITSSWHENVREDGRGQWRGMTFRKYFTDPWPLNDSYPPEDGPWQVKEVYQQLWF